MVRYSCSTMVALERRPGLLLLVGCGVLFGIPPALSPFRGTPTFFLGVLGCSRLVGSSLSHSLTVLLPDMRGLCSLSPSLDIRVFSVLEARGELTVLKDQST